MNTITVASAVAEIIKTVSAVSYVKFSIAYKDFTSWLGCKDSDSLVSAIGSFSTELNRQLKQPLRQGSLLSVKYTSDSLDIYACFTTEVALEVVEYIDKACNYSTISYTNADYSTTKVGSPSYTLVLVEDVQENALQNLLQLSDSDRFCLYVSYCVAHGWAMAQAAKDSDIRDLVLQELSARLERHNQTQYATAVVKYHLELKNSLLAVLNQSV